MNTVLFFALRRRFGSYVNNTELTISLILRILFVVMLLVNAAMIGWLIDVFIEAHTNEMTGNNLIRLVSTGFCGLWALLEFFPTYTYRSTLISGVFPIHFTERWTANLVYDTMTALTAGTVIAFCLIDALSKTYTHTHLANSLLLFCNTMAFVQLTKAFTENTHRNLILLLTAWVMLTGSATLLVVYQSSDSYILMSGLAFCLVSQLTLLFCTDRSVVAPVNSPVFSGNFPLLSQISPVYVAFFNNPKSRNAFLFGLALKAAFLSFSGIPAFSQLPMAQFLETVYVAPLILFTYIANNSWGFFPVLWVNSTLGKRSDNYRIYFQLITIPVFLDMVITFGIMLYTGKVGTELLAFYSLATVILGVNGLVFSQYKAFYVQSSFNLGQMKNNVNGWSIFVSAVLVSLAMATTKTVITTLLFGLSMIAVCWYVLNKVLPNDTRNNYTLHKQLFINRV